MISSGAVTLADQHQEKLPIEVDVAPITHVDYRDAGDNEHFAELDENQLELLEGLGDLQERIQQAAALIRANAVSDRERRALTFEITDAMGQLNNLRRDAQEFFPKSPSLEQRRDPRAEEERSETVTTAVSVLEESFETQAEAMQEQVEAEREARQEAETRATEAEQKLAEANQKLDAAVDQAAKAAEQVAAIEKQAAEAGKLAESTEKAKAQLQKRLAASEDTRRELETELEAVRAQLKEMEADESSGEAVEGENETDASGAES